MVSDLIPHLIAGFVIGAIGASAISIASERFGTRLGGALGGFPASMVASLFLIGHSRGARAAQGAAEVVPLMMGIFGVFVVTYCSLLNRGLLVALPVSLAVWGLLALIPILVPGIPLGYSLGLWIVLLFGTYWALECRLQIASQLGKSVTLSLPMIAFRMSTGGLIVAFAVLAGAVGGPVLGGVVASLPAVTVASLVVTYFAGGPKFSAAVSKSLGLNAMLNATVFALTVIGTFADLGIYGGTAFGVCAVLLWAALSHRYLGPFLR